MGRLDSLQREGANRGNTVIFQEIENTSECRRLIISFILVLHVHVYFEIFLPSNCKENFLHKFPFLLVKNETRLSIKPRPNDRNMSTQHCWAQHVACVWPPCCDVLRHVGCCWLKFENGQIWANNTQHVATCCTQQCCDMLRWHVAIVWPGLQKSSNFFRLKKGHSKKLTFLSSPIASKQVFPFTEVSASEVICRERSDFRGCHFKTVLGSQAVFMRCHSIWLEIGGND